MKRFSLLLTSVALAVTGNAFAAGGALSLIPRDAITVGVIHVADVRNSPIFGALVQQTDKFGGDGDAERFLTDAGLRPSSDVDLLMVATRPSTLQGEPDVLVVAEGRFDPERLSKALVSRGAAAKDGYVLLPVSRNEDHHGAVAFPDSHTAIVGSETAVIQALADRKSGGTNFFTASALGREQARMDAGATAWALVDVKRASLLSKDPVRGSGDQGKAVSAAMKNVSTVALWATDSGTALKLSALGISHDAETLGLLEDTIRGSLAAMRLAMQDQNPEMVPVLRQFDVQRTSDSITLTGTLSGDALHKLQQKAASSHHNSHSAR